MIHCNIYCITGNNKYKFVDCISQQKYIQILFTVFIYKKTKRNEILIHRKGKEKKFLLNNKSSFLHIH